MPEGPEVNVMTEFLNKYYKNCDIKMINILSGRYIDKNKTINMFDDLIKDLPIKINDYKCHGKFMYWVLEKDWYIFLTLGLKGRISIGDLEKHNRLQFITTCGDFYFRDQLNNGTIHIYKGKKELDIKLKKLGIDLLQTNMSNKDIIEYCKKKYNKKRKKDDYIADILLDQKFLAGVGNYIRADSLYCAKISPFRKFLDINDDEFIKLIKCIKDIMTNSYEKQISNISEKYKYENIASFYIPLVYSRKITDKNEKVENEKMKFQNRTIWYVPSVQI